MATPVGHGFGRLRILPANRGRRKHVQPALGRKARKPPGARSEWKRAVKGHGDSGWAWFWASKNSTSQPGTEEACSARSGPESAETTRCQIGVEACGKGSWRLRLGMVLGV